MDCIWRSTCKIVGMPRRKSSYEGDLVSWYNPSVRSPKVAFGQTRYQPGGYCGPRIQRDYELVVLHTGDAEVEVGRKTYPLQQKFVYAFRPGLRNHFRFSRTMETHHSWCEIIPDFMPEDVRRELDVMEPTGVPCTEPFNRIFSTAFLLRSAGAHETHRAINALGLALFAEFLDTGQRAREEKEMEPCVIAAVHYMEDHFGDPQCLTAAQTAAGCSSNTLLYKFTAAKGMTPGRYLWNLRTDHGLELLGKTGLSISEIAYKCGFKDPFHFSRKVRERQGLSPREVRNRAWK